MEADGPPVLHPPLSAPALADPGARVEIPVYYDVASSLCHVAHRVIGRMAPLLDELDLGLVWIPIDLAALLNWRRGHLVSDQRRDHIHAIADGLGVPVTVPTRWLDSRPLHALLLTQLAHDRARGERGEPTLRERVFTRVFDEARPCEGKRGALEMATECGIEAGADDLEPGLEALEAWTRHAADQMVSGVPTFMLGPWPFGGIQQEATMESLFRRWTEKVRSGRADGGADR